MLLKHSILTGQYLEGRVPNMTDILIVACSTACILTAVESFIASIGKWRGLLALGASLGGLLTLSTELSCLPVYGLAATFLGLTVSIATEQIFAVTTVRNLPRRIPPL